MHSPPEPHSPAELQTGGDRGCQQLARPLRRLDGGVAHHQRDAARVRAEIDRRQIRIAGDGAYIEWIDPEHLRDDCHQHVVGALPDLGGAAEHRHAAAAIQLQLHAGVRKVVPVDREPGARQIRRAGQTHAAAVGQLAELLAPVRSIDDAADAFGEADRADAQVIGGEAVGFGDHAEAQIRGVLLHELCNLVELNFLAEP